MNRMTKEHIEQFEGYVANIMKEYDAVGVAVSIVDPKGVTQYEKYFGYRNEEDKTLMDENTIFGLASVTKSFTCLAIMQLAEQGIIDIQAPVTNYIPEFKNLNQKEPVRVWHLMCHSGGYFPLLRILIEPVAESLGLSEDIDGDFAYNEAIAIEGVKLVAERLDAQKNLIGRPGELMSYCNDGFALLSDIVRRYGDQDSFARYLNKHILEPLGMTRSYCDFVKPKKDANSASLYIKKKGVRTVTHNYHDNAFVLNGGGAMKSTISDMKRYITMFLNEGCGLTGKRIANEYSIREMCKTRQVYRPLGHYGYGLSMKFLDDLTVVEHGGSLTGVSSNMSWSYEAEAGIMVLCNTSSVPVSYIANAAMRMYNGKSPIDSRSTYQDTTWDMDWIKEVCGLYESGEGTTVELYMKEDNSLAMKVDEKEQNIQPVQPELAIIRGKITDGFLKIHKNEVDGVWGIGYGGRIIPKTK